MAQNRWINVTVDPAMSKRTDMADHRHTVARAGSASGDLTISFDTAKVTSLTQLRSAILAAIANAASELGL